MCSENVIYQPDFECMDKEKESLFVYIDVILKEPYTLGRFCGKARRVYDFRFSDDEI